MLCVLIDLNYFGYLIILGVELHHLSRKLMNVTMPVSCLIKYPNEKFEPKEEILCLSVQKGVLVSSTRARIRVFASREEGE